MKAILTYKRVLFEAVGALAMFAAGYGVFSLTHKPSSTTAQHFLSDKEVTVLHESTKSFVSFLDKHNIEYWAVGGTLIGALRNHPPGPLRWDDDSDFAMFEDQHSNFLKAIEEDSSFKDTFLKTDAGFGYQFKLKKYDQDPDVKKEYNLDMFIYEKEKDDSYSIKGGSWKEFSISQKSDILPLRRCSFWDFTMNCPHKLTQPMNGYGGDKVLTEAQMWSHAGSSNEKVNLSTTINEAFLVPMLNNELLRKLTFSEKEKPIFNFEELDHSS